MERCAQCEESELICVHVNVRVCLCEITCLAVVAVTVWPSCFNVLGLRPDKLSLGTVVRKTTTLAKSRNLR